jgi:hypothetical protein
VLRRARQFRRFRLVTALPRWRGQSPLIAMNGALRAGATSSSKLPCKNFVAQAIVVYSCAVGRIGAGIGSGLPVNFWGR